MSTKPTRSREGTRAPAIDRRRAKRVSRPKKGAERVSRRTLREGLGKSQAEVAVALGTDQGEVSRIERRRDVGLATLRRYVEALGAELEVVAVFPDGARVALADPEEAEPPK